MDQSSVETRTGQDLLKNRRVEFENFSSNVKREYDSSLLVLILLRACVLIPIFRETFASITRRLLRETFLNI